MKILPAFNNNLYLNFRSNKYKDDFVPDDESFMFADVDKDTQCALDAIRAHLFFSTGFGNDSAVQGNRYSFVPETLDDVHIPNLRKIGNNSCRGESLNFHLDKLDLLPRSGIQTVIDLHGYYDLQKACEDENINYFAYPASVQNYFQNPIFKNDDEINDKIVKKLSKQSLTKSEFDQKFEVEKVQTEIERKKFMKDFIELTKVINAGNFYIGCEYGDYRTSNILTLNSYFNPNWIGKKSDTDRPWVLNAMRNMYNNLSEEDKQKLGFNETFEKELRSKLFDE